MTSLLSCRAPECACFGLTLLRAVRVRESRLSSTRPLSTWRRRPDERAVSIFTSTYNVEDCKSVREITVNLGEWLPLRQDLYCIAFQVCPERATLSRMTGFGLDRACCAG